MAKAKAAKTARVRRAGPPIHETALERLSRQARERDSAAQARQPLVTPEARAHGDYHEAWTEEDGQRARVLLNRGGSTIQRWLNAPACEILGDAERTAIRYCQGLWHKVDHKGLSLVRVDNGRADGLAEHEALAELGGLSARLPRRHWNLFENICRFEYPAANRQAKVIVGMVASLIAMWRGF